MKRSVRSAIRVIGPSIAYVPLTKKKVALIDLADAETVEGYNWYAFHHKKQNKFYAVSKLPKTTGLQRFLLGLRPGDKLNGDHKNHNTLDYRRTNLRIATCSQNSINKVLLHSNKSGRPGLHQLTGTSSWRVTIKRDNKVVVQRQFDSYYKAIAFWDETYPPLSGEFAYPMGVSNG